MLRIIFLLLLLITIGVLGILTYIPRCSDGLVERHYSPSGTMYWYAGEYRGADGPRDSEDMVVQVRGFDGSVRLYHVPPGPYLMDLYWSCNNKPLLGGL